MWTLIFKQKDDCILKGKKASINYNDNPHNLSAPYEITYPTVQYNKAEPLPYNQLKIIMEELINDENVEYIIITREGYKPTR